jgi:type I restriction enzyme S subunit
MTSEGWRETTVGEWAPFHYGKGLPERDRHGGEVPVYGSNGVVGWHHEALIHEPGIVIGRKGTVGSVKFSSAPFWPIDTTYFVKQDASRDLRFTSALLDSLGLEGRNSHSAVPGLSRDDVHLLPISVPALEVQQQIGEVLEALDSRITILKLMLSKISEVISAACEAAIESRASSDAIPLPKAVRLVNGGAFTKGASGSGRMVIRIKELNSGPSDSTVYNNIQVPDEKTARSGDVLFAWSGSLGIWRWYSEEAIINQHIFKVVEAEQPVWLGWHHISQELETFKGIAAGKATTMGHITKDHLERTLVPALSKGEVAELGALIGPLWSKQLQVGIQLETLEDLLRVASPGLVAGELRVGDVALKNEVLG